MRAPVAVLASAADCYATPLGFASNRGSRRVWWHSLRNLSEILYLSSDLAAFDALFRECVKLLFRLKRFAPVFSKS